MEIELRFLFSAHCLIMLYICTKFIFIGFKVMSGYDFHYENIKGVIPSKMRVELRFMCSAHRLMMLYICTRFHKNTLSLILDVA